MSVMTKNAVLAEVAAEDRHMEERRPELAPVASTAAHYREVWQSFYDEAIASGESPSGARFVAHERLVRVQAADAGVTPPGVGDRLSY